MTSPSACRAGCGGLEKGWKGCPDTLFVLGSAWLFSFQRGRGTGKGKGDGCTCITDMALHGNLTLKIDNALEYEGFAFFLFSNLQ